MTKNAWKRPLQELLKIADTNDLAFADKAEGGRFEVLHPLEIACAIAAIDQFIKEKLYPIRKASTAAAVMFYHDALFHDGGYGKQLMESLQGEHRKQLGSQAAKAFGALQVALVNDDWAYWETLCDNITNITHLDKLT